MHKYIYIIVSNLFLNIQTHLKYLSGRLFLTLCLVCFSSITFAQLQVVTDPLTAQLGLDFSDPQPNDAPYLLVVGSNGALYLRDTATGSHLKISQRMNGVPAKVVPGGTSRLLYQADKNFENIVYVSKDPNISPGDSGDSEDVFIYNVSSKKTIRIEGHKPHAGPIGQVRINAEGDTVAFNSKDWYFADTSNIDRLGYNLDQFDGEQYLVYLAKIIDFNSGASLPFTPKYTALPFDASRDSLGTSAWLCYPSCQFQGDSIIFKWENPNFIFSNGYLYGYNIKREVLTDIEFSYSSEVGDASNNADYINDARHIIVGTTEYTLGGGGDNLIDYLVYDTLLNDKFPFLEDFPTLNHNNFIFTDSSYKARGAVSENNRYLTFYAMKLQGHEFKLDYNTGIIHVFDTWTGEFRPAFSVDRNAQSFGYTDPNTYDYYKTTCIDCDGIDDYEIEPTAIRFHNNDQYITFEGNSWYLDPSIAYDDFVVPYARNVFVVPNPFKGDEDLASCGAPDTSISVDDDVYLWRDCDTGQWRLQVLGDDSPQNISGAIVSGQNINNVLAENLEAADQYSHASNKLNFNLDLQAGDEDGFSFYLGNLAGTCIDITNTETINVRIGARQVALSVPFDLKTLAPVSNCDDGSITVDGAPSINQSTDQGWFIWRENGVWQHRFVAGGTRLRLKGSLESNAPMDNLLPFSIEAGDTLQLDPANELNFDLIVKGPYIDGFGIAVSNSAKACVTLSSPATANIYLGPDRVIIPSGFDLHTLTNCQDSPDIETKGRPDINRSTDAGIFIWESETNPNRWIAHVVSGDTPRLIGVDVNSSGIISNIQKVSIESSDVFTILPNGLDLSLNVAAPWLDGFKFTDQAQADTCVSTTHADIPIYVGPNRVNVGNNINLKTLTSCL